MKNEKQLWSAQEMADDIKVRLSQVLYAITNLDLVCIDVVAKRRVYSIAQKSLIEKELNRIKDERLSRESA